MKTYEALADCIAGGVLRRKGDVFSMRPPKSPPKYLKEVGGKGEDVQRKGYPPKTGKPAPTAAGPGKEDIGAGKPRPAHKTTSSDVVPEK